VPSSWDGQEGGQQEGFAVEVFLLGEQQSHSSTIKEVLSSSIL